MGIQKDIHLIQHIINFFLSTKSLKEIIPSCSPLSICNILPMKNSFVINYGRRINRPNYQDLNPFINFLDRYTFQQGNPNLKPQFSHNIELSHTYKGFLTTTLNYSNTTDIIQQVLEQNEITNETYVKKQTLPPATRQVLPSVHKRK